MAETLGSLCDKLTIVKLKQWHTTEQSKSESLKKQAEQLSTEINEYICAAIQGDIPLDKLIFSANKVYKSFQYDGLDENKSLENLGNIISNLSETNFALWREQEKVYEFEQVPMDQKDHVIKQLAFLNLERNKYIEKIDGFFANLIRHKNS